MDVEHPRSSIYLEGSRHGAPIPNAARVGPLVMTGSVTGRDPVEGTIPDDLAEEFTQLFANLATILTAAGATMDHVVKLEVTLRDRDQRTAFDPVWTAVFPDEAHRPARHVLASDLPGKLNAQAQATAYVTDGSS